MNGGLDQPGLREPGPSRALPRLAAAFAGTNLDAGIRAQHADAPRHHLGLHAGRTSSVQRDVGSLELLLDPADGFRAELARVLGPPALGDPGRSEAERRADFERDIRVAVDQIFRGTGRGGGGEPGQ